MVYIISNRVSTLNINITYMIYYIFMYEVYIICIEVNTIDFRPHNVKYEIVIPTKV